MFESNVQSKGFRVLIDWAFLIPMVVLYMLISDRAPGALSSAMEWLCLALFWALVILRMLFKKYVKANVSPEEREQMELEEQNRLEEKSKDRFSGLIIVILIIIGVYLTAWVLKK